jgi:peptidyl-prolyl cis-trans isomerase D
MLDIMRRKKRLKVILWVVIFGLAVGMLLFFVPGVDMGNVATDSSAAVVDGESISIRDFVTSYRRIVDRYTDGGRNNIDPETLKAMGVPNQVLNSLIAQKVVQIVAERFGVEVSPEELRKAVESQPSFQNEGKFIGVELYKALLAANNYSVVDFERDLYLTELTRKLHRIVTDSLEVTDSALRDEFSRTTQKTKIDFVVLEKDSFIKKIKPTESELRTYFEENNEKYQIMEKRRAQYLLVPTSEILPTIRVTEQEILDEWENMPHGETVEASHILFRVDDPNKDSEVRAKAEKVLKRVKSGEDFAALAREYSEDPGSASQGGYLGPFQRGQMVAEFEQAAFTLEPGTISELVKTTYGYHIIKVLNRETPSLEDNRDSLMETVRSRKAADMARQKAEQAAKAAQEQEDLELAAEGLGIKTEIRESELFSKNDNPFQYAVSQEFIDAVFALKEIGSIGQPVEHPLGYAVPKLIEVQLPKSGNFEDSRQKVESDYIESRSVELMQTEAGTLSQEARKQGSLPDAAKKMGLKTKTSQEFTISESPDPDIGPGSDIAKAAFYMAPGDVSAPQPLGNKTVVFQVISRSPFDETAFREQKEDLRSQMLQAMKDPYFENYIREIMDELEKDGKIRINPEAIESVSLYY